MCWQQHSQILLLFFREKRLDILFESPASSAWKTIHMTFLCVYGTVNLLGHVKHGHLPNHTFTGQAKSLTSLLPETDNCPSWISGREKEGREWPQKIFHDHELNSAFSRIWTSDYTIWSWECNQLRHPDTSVFFVCVCVCMCVCVCVCVCFQV